MNTYVETTDDERALIIGTVRDFARNELAPRVREYDREEQLPHDIVERLVQLDLLGGVVPTEWGGLGLDHSTYALMLEEVSTVCHSTGVLMSMPSGLVGAGLLHFGTDEQKEEFLRPLARGEKFGGTGVTEPRSGTDVSAMETTAERKGGDYILRGAKTWISNLDLADFFITFASLDRNQGRSAITAFIVPSNSPGLVKSPFQNKTGFRPLKTGDLILDEVRVPARFRLGEEGEGLKVAMTAVENGRLSVAARSVGLIRACLEESCSYAKDRVVFDQTIGEFQLVQSKITDMIVGMSTARALVLQLAEARSAGRPARQLASMAKMYASDMAMKAATDAMQIHGAYGCSDEYPVSRHFRDAKFFQIVEGSNDLHRALIAEIELGLKPNR